jgi:mRNA interferase YafQ
VYSINYSTKFKKDYKLCLKRGFNINELHILFQYLHKDGMVPQSYKPHKLSGNYTNCWECHIKPDWLLIWEIDQISVNLIRTGKHSDLFK